MPTIALGYCDKVDVDLAKKIAQQWQFEYIGDAAAAKHRQDIDFLLQVDNQTLSLKKLDEPKLGGVLVDFVEGASAHRRKFGGGRGQDIAKAVGLKHGFTPTVLDATAGLGRDAFVLASLGCQVTLIERVPAVAALLENGIERALLNVETATIAQNMQLQHCSSIDEMQQYGEHDIVYLDPMYPHREKSAAVKKEMRVFQTLVGEDLDADKLFEPAFELAKYRVVVKRPNYAEPIAGKKPSTSIKMKKNRFDVYVKQGIPKA
ncbi:class I SAM-dependent methyltransferase [Thalassotalea eurytherma]|uniref:Ribosomal RNA small subunit methyltransferase J n=1 Tax=Thalassotalea eurytherma TaxID=1144278 RepID=A0ABQ6H5T9_9GAMM|nr:class I SAM-dependent methyltransferase [Thalassotalea eurytherma]GLX82187.1 ribosomal RNA small subunit methyltransferase J [Thalassotalea eurytherma]